MVSPNAELLDVSDLGVSLQSDLSEGSVVIESSHGSEVLLGEIFSVVLCDEAVSVSGVADNNGLDVSVSVIVDGLAGVNEDLSVVLEQV